MDCVLGRIYLGLRCVDSVVSVFGRTRGAGREDAVSKQSIEYQKGEPYDHGFVQPPSSAADASICSFCGHTQVEHAKPWKAMTAVDRGREAVERLAALIREVDGDHSLGAAALAEALLARVALPDGGCSVFGPDGVASSGGTPIEKPLSAIADMAVNLGPSDLSSTFRERRAPVPAAPPCELSEAVEIIKALRRGDCWCEKGIGNPMFKVHTNACQHAQDFLNGCEVAATFAALDSAVDFVHNSAAPRPPSGAPSHFDGQAWQAQEFADGSGWYVRDITRGLEVGILDMALPFSEAAAKAVARALNNVANNTAGPSGAPSEAVELCSVCCRQPLASGRECICGGVGTALAETQGLRERVVDLEIALGFFPNIPRTTSKAYKEVQESLDGALPLEPTPEMIEAMMEQLYASGHLEYHATFNGCRCKKCFSAIASALRAALRQAGETARAQRERSA